MALSLDSGGISLMDKGGLAGLRRGRSTGRRGGVDPEDYAMLMRDLADRNAENIVQRNTGGGVVYTGVPGQFHRAPGGPAPISQDAMLATARTAAPGAQLGTPESYGGQGPLTVADVSKARQQGQIMGAEGQPIEVIRRLGVTYQGPNAAEEYGTVGQARQAMRRDIGAGEYISPAMDTATAKATAGKIDPNLMKLSQDNFRTSLQQYATVNPTTGEAMTPDVISKKAMELLPTITSPEDVQTAMGELTKVKAEHDLLTSPSARKTMLDNLASEVKRIEKMMDSKTAVDANTARWYQAAPRIKQVIESGDFKAEYYPGFRDLLNMKPPATAAPASKSEQTASESPVAKAIDYGTMLGQTMGYELQPQRRKAGEPAPTLEAIRKQRLSERERLLSEQ